MRRDLFHTGGMAVLSIACGWIGWSGHVLLLPTALGFPLLWANAKSRSTAVLVSAGYFLAASRGLPQGVAAYYASDIWPGIAFWLVASTSFVLVHSILWTDRQDRRPVRYLIAAVLMAIPPFGITGWAHPVTAAGVLFPGWAWWGVLAMTAGLGGLVSRFGPAVAIGLAFLWLWSAASWTDLNLAGPWYGVDFKMGSSLGRDNSLARQTDLLASVKDAEIAGADVVVLPESALGYWTPTAERFWTREIAKAHATVLGGAAIVNASGYDNVLVAIGRSGSNVVYHERMPVPGAMWQPWRSWFGKTGGARADFFANPVVDLAGKKIAPLICYEQLIVWPILASMVFRPEMIVSVGNDWWADQSSIVGIQRASSITWARLFGLPLVMSFNT
jgi:hypothetical protein